MYQFVAVYSVSRSPEWAPYIPHNVNTVPRYPINSSFGFVCENIGSEGQEPEFPAPTTYREKQERVEKSKGQSPKSNYFNRAHYNYFSFV